MIIKPSVSALYITQNRLLLCLYIMCRAVVVSVAHRSEQMLAIWPFFCHRSLCSEVSGGHGGTRARVSYTCHKYGYNDNIGMLPLRLTRWIQIHCLISKRCWPSIGRPLARHSPIEHQGKGVDLPALRTRLSATAPRCTVYPLALPNVDVLYI